jgi:hypothetical protein
MIKKAGRPRKREQATKQTTLWMTEEAITSLDRVAALRGISRSELVERIARDEETLMRVK